MPEITKITAFSDVETNANIYPATLVQTLNDTLEAYSKYDQEISAAAMQSSIKSVDGHESIELVLASIDLTTVIEAAIKASADSIKARHHILSVSTPIAQVKVQGDGVRLVQIVTNLFLNVQHLLAEGDEIKLDTEIVDNRVRVRFSGVSKSPSARLSALKNSESQLFDGVGIGLGLIHTLVALHGGIMQTYNFEESQGCMYEISLPIDATDSQDSMMPNDTSEKLPTRVLIVDDNVDVVTTLSQWLKLGGYDVHMAYNGAQAVTATAEFKPQIILLDIGLPDLNGYDLALKLRKLPDVPSFLLVAVTGYGQGSDGKEFLDAGFDRHFAKPMDLSKLESIGLHV